MGGGQLQRNGCRRWHAAGPIGASDAGCASPIRAPTVVPRDNASARSANARRHCTDTAARRAARSRGADASARCAGVHNGAASCGIGSGAEGPAAGHCNTGSGATFLDVPRGGV
jgi:hypothetical protein